MRDDQDESGFIYKGSFFRIGKFRRGPNHPDFNGPHQTGGALIVFPRTSVTITHAGKEPVIADPNVVMFYNDGQVYSREKLAEQGDRCEYFGFDSRLICDAIRPFDAHVDDHPSEPFQFTHGPSEATSYMLQRLIVTHILESQQPDSLLIEETVLQVLDHVIENHYRQRGFFPSKTKASNEKEIVDAVQKVLVNSFERNLSLEQISSQLHYSPFHLSRLFRKHTGRSIHQYLNQLRLRSSLEQVTQSDTDLTRLALRMGFASHSHFTETFRKTFGAPPSRLRDPSSQQMRQFLSKISIA